MTLTVRRLTVVLADGLAAAVRTHAEARPAQPLCVAGGCWGLLWRYFFFTLSLRRRRCFGRMGSLQGGRRPPLNEGILGTGCPKLNLPKPVKALVI